MIGIPELLLLLLIGGIVCTPVLVGAGLLYWFVLRPKMSQASDS